MTATVLTLKGRLTLTEYVRLLTPHYKRYWKIYVAVFGTIFLFQCFFRLDFNLTGSLPDHVYLTVKGAKSDIKEGDHLTFIWRAGGPYPVGMNFVKIVGAVPGDRIVMDEERNFFRDGNIVSKTFLGRAKTQSRTGQPLAAGPTGVIPPGHYYVMTPHPDSLDSRYAMTGWISESDIVGKCYALF